MRFTTVELSEIEGGSHPQPSGPWRSRRRSFKTYRPQLPGTSRDCRPLQRRWRKSIILAALAELAVSENYVRPEISETGGLKLRGGRHPFVEQALAAVEDRSLH